MLFLNSWITTTRLSGVPAIAQPRFVQLDDDSVSAGGGGLSTSQGSTQAGAPTLDKTLYDWPAPAGFPQLYQRGDLVVVLGGAGQPSPYGANPFHITKVQGPFEFLPAMEIRISRLDFLTQPVTWLPRITPTTATATPASGYDTVRQMETVNSDGSFGVGWNATDDLTGLPRGGYLSGRPATIAVNDAAVTARQAVMGLLVYEKPVIMWEAPQAFSKWDVLILADGRRVVVEDVIQAYQTFGVTLGYLATVELRNPGDIVYSVPT